MSYNSKGGFKMEKEKKEISRKALIGIIIALIIIVVIAFGVIIYFVSSNNKEIGKNISSETTLDDNEIINKIYKVLDNVNNEYELGFNPNTEQMNEIIDFYKSTSNFNEESLFNFIGEKGWTISGTGQTTNSDYTTQGIQTNNVLSDTEIKTIIRKDWNHYHENSYKATIDKIEKYEEDGKGRYIYVVYWHDVDRRVEEYGITGYELGGYSGDYNGKVDRVTAYVINSIEKSENAILTSVTTNGKEPYQLVEKVKTNKECNWGNNIELSTGNNNLTNKITQEDINQSISFFNSYYKWNFKPTDEQMQEMIKFANSTDKFGNDALEKFIKEKGWLTESSNSNSNNKKVKYKHTAISGCELVNVDSSANYVEYVPKCVHCGAKEKAYSTLDDVLVCQTQPHQYFDGTYKDSFHCVECGKNYDIIITITETYE